jgi:hypothetical protein
MLHTCSRRVGSANRNCAGLDFPIVSNSVGDGTLRRPKIFEMVSNAGENIMKARFTIALAAAATLGASVAGAQFVSQPTDGKTTSEAPKNALPATIAPSPAGAGGLMIFIDPLTGKIRQPDAADISELLSLRPQPQTPFIARPFVSPTPGGGVGVMLDDSFHNYMVVTKKPDGSLLMDCLPDAGAAADALANGLKSGETLHKKEVLDVQ